MHRLKLVASVGFGLAFVGLLAAGVHAYATYAHYSTSPMPYYLNPDNLYVTADAAEAAVQYGASAWTNQTHASFSFSYGGRVTDTAVTYDGRNVVMFRNATNGGALATTYSWFVGSTLSEADVVVWEGASTFFTGTSGCWGGAYIEDVLTHEFGHALGMMHSTVATATMYPYYSTCSEDLRTLDPDDISGVESLYPPSGTTPTAPTVTIASPLNGSSTPQNASVTFAGSATDKQDGDISAKLTWASSIDGAIGTGASFSTTLSAGTHTITASVIDSAGLQASKAESITITAPCDRADPTVSISPTPTWVADGTAQSYSVKVTNNDSSTCGSTSFSLLPTVPANWMSTLSATAVTVGAGSSASATLKTTAPTGTPDGAYAITVAAVNSLAQSYAATSTAVENTISSLAITVSTSSPTYFVGQTVNITVRVMQSQAPLTSTKVTITVLKPDGSVLKRFTPNTSSSGTATVSFKAGTPRGTYTINVSATKGSISGTATTTFAIQ